MAGNGHLHRHLLTSVSHLALSRALATSEWLAAMRAPFLIDAATLARYGVPPEEARAWLSLLAKVRVARKAEVRRSSPRPKTARRQIERPKPVRQQPDNPGKATP
jgi:hypothetical protein